MSYRGRGGGDRGRGGGDRGRGGGDRGRGWGDRGGGGFRGGGGRGGGRGGGGGGRDNTVRVFSDPASPLTPPDGRVTNIEDAYMKSGATTALAKLSLTEHMPARPGYGTQGKKIMVYANYFKLNVPKELSLTRYNVEFLPEVKGKKLGRMFQLLLGKPEFAGVATEWRSMIISSRPLNIPDGFTIQIPYRAEGEDEALERAITYTARIVTPLSFNVSDFVNFLASTNPAARFEQKAEVIQVLNAVLGHHPHSRTDLSCVGQNKYFLTDRSARNQANIKQLGGGLESLRGYFQSVRAAAGGILVNVNVMHGVFLEPRVLNQLYPLLGSANKDTLRKKLKGVRVKLLHLPGKKSKAGVVTHRVKTIFALARPGDGRTEEHPPRISAMGAGPKGVQFWLSETPSVAAPSNSAKPKKPAAAAAPGSGKYISVFEFFKMKYNVQLNDTLPVVNVGNADHPSYLPAEVCEVLPGQTIKRRLGAQQTQEMITFACRKPWENATSIVNDGRDVLGHDNPTLGQFGVQIGSSLLTVNARLLQPPRINYKDQRSNKPSQVNPRFGSWNLAEVKFSTGSNIGVWTYIYFASDRRGFYPGENDIRGVVVEFGQFMTRTGVDASKLIVPGPTVNLRDGFEKENDDAIKNIFRAMYEAKGGKPKPNFVLCVLPFNDVAIYNSIKGVADTKAGINTVCCVGSKFIKSSPQYFGNVSMKFNLKAGGINQVLDAPKLGIVSEGKTMVVGIDVTHPSPGSKEGAPSVAGIVASVDKFLGQWPADFDVQEGRKEMVSSLERMVMGRLNLWEKKNRNLPENLLIYRDGVSEGQYQQVLELELPLIQKACRQKYPATATQQGFPKISIIICGKRHHTRFYPTTEQNADRSSNCEPGTVVDRGVTEAGVWEFFIQPHACLQGTARPCHYIVIFDQIFRARKPVLPHTNAADALEELTHNMCHLFGRATKAVSLCPPAYYADLLCERMRCYLADQYNPSDRSDTASTTSGATGQPALPEIRIPDNMKDTMFYI